MGHGFHNEVVPDATYPPSTPQGVLALEPCKSSGAGDGDVFCDVSHIFRWENDEKMGY